jgi:hypothetical protein
MRSRPTLRLELGASWSISDKSSSYFQIFLLLHKIPGVPPEGASFLCDSDDSRLLCGNLAYSASARRRFRATQESFGMASKLIPCTSTEPLNQFVNPLLTDMYQITMCYACVSTPSHATQAPQPRIPACSYSALQILEERQARQPGRVRHVLSQSPICWRVHGLCRARRSFKVHSNLPL